MEQSFVLGVGAKASGTEKNHSQCGAFVKSVPKWVPYIQSNTVKSYVRCEVCDPHSHLRSVGILLRSSWILCLEIMSRKHLDTNIWLGETVLQFYISM